MKREECLLGLLAFALVCVPIAAEEPEDERPEWRAEPSVSIAPAAMSSHPAERMSVRLGGFAARFKPTGGFGTGILCRAYNAR